MYQVDYEFHLKSGCLEEKHNGKEKREYRMGQGIAVSSTKINCDNTRDNNHSNHSKKVFMC